MGGANGPFRLEGRIKPNYLFSNEKRAGVAKVAMPRPWIRRTVSPVVFSKV
jgi:hypothetical protein